MGLGLYSKSSSHLRPVCMLLAQRVRVLAIGPLANWGLGLPLGMVVVP